jgi:hypothetical protein
MRLAEGAVGLDGLFAESRGIVVAAHKDVVPAKAGIQFF